MKCRPPPVGSWFTVCPWSSPWRRLRRMPWLAEAPPRHPANLDDFPCPVSLRGDRERQVPPGARGHCLAGHQLPAHRARARHDVVGDADLVLLEESPLPTGGTDVEDYLVREVKVCASTSNGGFGRFAGRQDRGFDGEGCAPPQARQADRRVRVAARGRAACAPPGKASGVAPPLAPASCQASRRPGEDDRVPACADPA